MNEALKLEEKIVTRERIVELVNLVDNYIKQKVEFAVNDLQEKKICNSIAIFFEYYPIFETYKDKDGKEKRVGDIGKLKNVCDRQAYNKLKKFARKNYWDDAEFRYNKYNNPEKLGGGKKEEYEVTLGLLSNPSGPETTPKAKVEKNTKSSKILKLEDKQEQKVVEKKPTKNTTKSSNGFTIEEKQEAANKKPNVKEAVTIMKNRSDQRSMNPLDSLSTNITPELTAQLDDIVKPYIGDRDHLWKKVEGEETYKLYTVSPANGLVENIIDPFGIVKGGNIPTIFCYRKIVVGEKLGEDNKMEPVYDIDWDFVPFGFNEILTRELLDNPLFIPNDNLFYDLSQNNQFISPIYKYVSFQNTPWLNELINADIKLMEYKIYQAIVILNQQGVKTIPRFRFNKFESPDRFELISDYEVQIPMTAYNMPNCPKNFEDQIVNGLRVGFDGNYWYTQMGDKKESFVKYDMSGNIVQEGITTPTTGDTLGTSAVIKDAEPSPSTIDINKMSQPLFKHSLDGINNSQQMPMNPHMQQWGYNQAPVYPNPNLAPEQPMMSMPGPLPVNPNMANPNINMFGGPNPGMQIPQYQQWNAPQGYNNPFNVTVNTPLMDVSVQQPYPSEYNKIITATTGDPNNGSKLII